MDFIIIMKKTDLVSIVIPVFNEYANIGPLYKKIKRAVTSLNYEIVYVDDGSKDNTPNAIAELQKKDKAVKLIRFRRNFGKSAALAAGLKNAKGDIIITMDGDLQDDPSDIPKFLEKVNLGYDLVVGWKQKKYNWYSLKFIPSKVFNLLTDMLTGIKLHDVDCPFKAFKSEAAKGLIIYGELHRYIPVLVHQDGFKVAEVKIKNLPRISGESKFGSARILKGFLDLITVLFLTRFIKRPLHFFGGIGIFFLSLGTISGLYLLYVKFILGEMIGQRPLLILTILLIFLGTQFISIGLMGEMIVNTSQKKKDEYVIR